MQATRVDDNAWLLEDATGWMYVAYITDLGPERYQVTIMLPIKFSKERDLCVIDREVYSTQFWAVNRGLALGTLSKIVEQACSCMTIEHPIEIVNEFGGIIEPPPQFYSERKFS